MLEELPVSPVPFLNPENPANPCPIFSHFSVTTNLDNRIDEDKH
jgi:hypothetical protein